MSEKSDYKAEYWRRIHKVQDYIESNSGSSLTVDELAGIAGFSKYHFSRIFQGMLGESLVHYVNRIRMENALFMLAHRQDKNITDIAYDVGMSDSAVFSRAFRNIYGVSPREFRQEYSKNCKDSFLLSEYNGFTAKKDGDKELFPVLEQVTDEKAILDNGRTAADKLFPVTGNITIKELSPQRLVYVRHTGSYNELAMVYKDMVEELFSLADERGLLEDGANLILTMYHDNPEFTDEHQFRTSLCLSIPGKVDFHEDDSLAVMVLEGGKYVAGYFQITPDQYSDAWNYMYHEWLTGSGYVPANACPFELYLNNPNENNEHMSEVEIYVPIEPITF